jgi:hypothetical protein
VTLSPQLARMILSHVKISPELWAVLIKHTKPVDKSVRTNFIHFLLAFLFDGCVSIIRPLLEIKGKHRITRAPFLKSFSDQCFQCRCLCEHITHAHHSVNEQAICVVPVSCSYAVKHAITFLNLFVLQIYLLCP